MDTVEERVKSFKGWPHLKNPKLYNLVNAEKMAMAGFYCRKLVGSEDNVCCFMCGKNLDGWDPTDEAWREHCSHAPQCPLATLGVQSSREKTFEGRWIKERPSGATLSQAGFFYYPRTKEDDTAFCYQCGVGLDGWEEEDDPWHEHARRRPNCPFIRGNGLMEPAAFQRILGSSSESYIKELTPVEAQSLPEKKPIQKEQRQLEVKQVIEKKQEQKQIIEKKQEQKQIIEKELLKEQKSQPNVKQRESAVVENKENTEEKFQKPPKKKLARKESVIKEADQINAEEVAMFDSLVASGVIKREELELTLEDFVLKSLVQRELDFFDAHNDK